MQPQEVVDRLKTLVSMLAADGVPQNEFRTWAKGRVAKLNELFDYRPTEAMPNAYDLIKLSIHPTEPLILLNYTRVAHSRLHLYQNGWTDPIRYCRGIVFDHGANLVALPWPKFFNFNGNIKSLPSGRFSAWVKYDGHLGIIFEYQGRIHITTRGDFTSRTSVLAAQMMERYIEQFRWRPQAIRDTTLLVEILHPQTRVYLDYPGEKFVLLGTRSLHTLDDESDVCRVGLSNTMGLDLASRWEGSSIRDLVRLTRDASLTGEGFVVRFKNGERLKFKSVTYVQRMIRDSMGGNPYAYLVHRVMDGDLKSKLPFLDEETVAFARRFVRQVRAAINPRRAPKEQRRRLYGLPPEEYRTDAYKRACQELVRSHKP